MRADRTHTATLTAVVRTRFTAILILTPDSTAGIGADGAATEMDVTIAGMATVEDIHIVALTGTAADMAMAVVMDTGADTPDRAVLPGGWVDSAPRALEVSAAAAVAGIADSEILPWKSADDTIRAYTV